MSEPAHRVVAGRRGAALEPAPADAPHAPSHQPSGTGAVASDPTPARALRRRKHHLGFFVLASIVVGGMVFGIASLNVLLAQQSFRIDAAERRIEQLSTERLDLVREQATLSAPGRIAAWARRNGMRLPDDIRFLHASGARAATPAGAADPSAPEEDA